MGGGRGEVGVVMTVPADVVVVVAVGILSHEVRAGRERL